MNISIIRLALSMLFVNSVYVSSQILNPLSIGFGTSVQADIHSQSTLTIREGDIIYTNSIKEFSPNSKTNVSVAPEVNFTVPVMYRLAVFSRIQYQQSSYSATSLSGTIPSLIRIDGIDNVVYTTTGWQQSIDISQLNISAGSRYYVTDAWFIAGSGMIGLTLKETSESNYLTTNGTILVTDKTRKTMVESNYKSFEPIHRTAINIGTGYMIPLGFRINLIPEISYALALSSVRKGYGWTFNSVGAGVSVSYALD
jgi:hypothetical protein